MPAKTSSSGPKPSKSKGGLKVDKGKEKANVQGVQAEPSGNTPQETTWSWTTLAESAMSKHPAVFTKDARYFFLIVASSVKIYSVASGQVVSTLSAAPGRTGSSASTSSTTDGHADDITGLALNPHNQYQLLTASFDGCIKIWDFLDGILLKTIDVGSPITHLCVHPNFKDHVFVACKIAPKSKKDLQNGSSQHSVVFRVALRTTAATANLAVQKPTELMRIGKTRPVSGLVFSPSGTLLVATGGTKSYVVNTSDFKAGFTKFVSNETLTCLAFHPLEDYFATGDQTGQIRLWFCLPGVSGEPPPGSFGSEKRAQTTTLHWHAHAVESIAFAPNGAYLLSGGEEAVLVIWQLKTGKKEFVPRVGAPIYSVAIRSPPEGEQDYFLGLADGSYAFVSAENLRVSRSYARIKLDPGASSAGRTNVRIPLAIDPQTAHLILPSSHPSSLQIYSPSTSTLLSELEIAPSNRVSRKDDKPLSPPRVEHVSISEDGQWMATVDTRDGNDEGFGKDVFLKIWKADGNGSWILNTRIDRPHGTQEITSITFSPSGKDLSTWLFVTTGRDGNVKVWSARSVSNKSEISEIFWGNRSTFDYRGQQPSQATFSPDGSLLVIAHGSMATLWDPFSNILHGVLTCPEVKEIYRLGFVGRSGRYLAVASKHSIAIWDLIRNEVGCHLPFQSPISHLFTHAKRDSFAVVLQEPADAAKTQIMVFEPTSSTPSRIHTLPFRLLHAISSFQTSASQSDDIAYTLFGITSSWAVVCVGDDVRTSLTQTADFGAASISGVTDHRRTLFQDIFGDSAFVDTSQAQRQAQLDATAASALGVKPVGSSIKGLLDGPAHLLPPISTLFGALMESLLPIRSPPQPEQKIDQDEHLNIDVEMVPAPSLVAASKQRVVDDAEMNLFVNLFKEQRLQAESIAKAASVMNGNGTHASKNGTLKTQLATATTTRPSPTTTKSKQPPKAPLAKTIIPDAAPPPQSPRPESPMRKIGKKRKKSMG